MRKASVFLWFDSEAEDAARFYAETFPDSRIDNLVRPVNDVPGTKAGAVQIVEMTLLGSLAIPIKGQTDIVTTMLGAAAGSVSEGQLADWFKKNSLVKA